MSNSNPHYRHTQAPLHRRDRYDLTSGINDVNPPVKKPRMHDNRVAGPGHNYQYRHSYNINSVGGVGSSGHLHPMHHVSSTIPEYSSHRHNDNQHNEPNDPNKFSSFKQFISGLADNVNEVEAVTKYNEYKIGFKRDQAKRFFDEHKDEEWFMEKYRPPERQQKLKEQRQSRNRRLNVFMELLNNDWLKDVKVDLQSANKLQKFLDAVVVKLEGGNDDDLRILEEFYEKEDVKATADMKAFSEDAEKLRREQKLEKKNERSSDNPNPTEHLNNSRDDSINNDNDDSRSKNEDEGIDCDDKQTDLGEGSQQSKIKTEEGEILKDDQEEGDNEQQAEVKTEQKEEIEEPMQKSQDSEEQRKNYRTPLFKTSSIFLRTVHVGITKKEIEDTASKHDGFLRVALSDPYYPSSSNPKHCCRKAWLTFRFRTDINSFKDLAYNFSHSKAFGCETGAQVNREIAKKIRGVSGIFQHKLVVKSDIKNAVSIIMHLDRLRCIWQNDKIEEKPQEPSVNPNSETEKDNKEGEIECSETTNKEPIKNEDEIAVAQIEQKESQSLEQAQEGSLIDDQSEVGSKDNDLDKGGDLPKLQEQDKEPRTESMAVDNGGEIDNSNVECKNPLLEDIKEYIIEESNIEEHELIGSINKDEKEEKLKIEFTRDENLEKVLDKLLLYLRVVHSFDYYSVTEYTGEDDMPSRIGIMNARGTHPGGDIPLYDIKATIKNHQSRLRHILEEPTISEIEQKLLGKIDHEVAIEKFIRDNTKKLDDSKYLCLLSNKKFVGADFVRKHIINRKQDKLEEVRIEADYFNNYLADPKRPSFYQ